MIELHIVMSKLIDNYIILQSIESGDVVQTHKGRNLLTKQLVFIKTIKVQTFYCQQQLKDLIMNEINILKKISSDHIIKMIKMLKSNNNLYLIYEYAAEGLESYQLNFIQLLKSFTHIWRDIARCGVVHGNLRPSSLRFDNKVLKIKGLECGRLYDSPFFMPKVVAYSAPEILKGVSTQKSDVFSFGLILYKLLYGKLPYSQTITAQELELFWKTNDHIQLKQSSKSDEKLLRIMQNMLRKDLKNRLNWDQVWKSLQLEQGILDHNLARSTEDYSGDMGTKQSNLQQRSVQGGTNSSKIVRLMLCYGQRRNKVSMMAAVVKEMIALSENSDKIDQLIPCCIRLLKRYSCELRSFALSPGKYLSWVDVTTQKFWQHSELYQAAIHDDFQELDDDVEQELSVTDLIKEFKSLHLKESNRTQIKFCIKLLSDVHLVNTGHLVLKGTNDIVEEERRIVASQSPQQKA